VRCVLSGGRELTVKARSVVASGGAIGSSVLLMKSGITRNVGKRFSFNAGTPMLARFPRPIQGFDGVQMGAYVDLDDYLLESLFYPPLTFAVTLPGWFGKHFDRMKAYDRFASAGVLIGTEPNGRVKQTSLFRSLFGPVVYRMTDGDLKKLKRGMARLAQVFFEAGAETVYPATFADVELTASRFRPRPEDILSYLDERIREPEDLTLSSAHPQGGNAMSDDPSIGVVNSQFQVHGYDNLFVCDASVFPTTIRINPQLTIMAIADYFAHLGVL
jgi:choline dehydrogenase-like flavoprotein